MADWRIRFKKRVRGFDPDEDPNFPAIGRSIKHLDALAQAEGWKPLTSFVSEDPDVAMDLLDDEEEVEKLLGYVPDDDDLEKAIVKRLGKVRWYKPEDALSTVQSSIAAVEQSPERLPLEPKKSAQVVKDLKELQEALKRLVEHGVTFRFYVAYG
jgi:hypothetical protein